MKYLSISKTAVLFENESLICTNTFAAWNRDKNGDNNSTSRNFHFLNADSS